MGQQDEPPERFLWRGRSYLVQEVLTSWRERQPWWTQQAVEAVHGAQPCSESQHAVAVDRLTVLADGSERQVWRVRASSGRLAVVGVYDLAMIPGASARGEWRLLQIRD
ncbi:MAG: hypothetical protein CSA58_04880 [Micrococcales bacterium]|nr:MAG: hypothetical protein CSB46_06240 [Micrococcales bacterium]PIE27297.1 MAG: hypothetical protein CSA58_04880 [Micrococcales bacterium]